MRSFNIRFEITATGEIRNEIETGDTLMDALLRLTNRHHAIFFISYVEMTAYALQ